MTHGHSFVKRDGSELFKSLFIKSELAKSNGSDLLLGIKRGKIVKNIHKKNILSDLLVFCQQFA